MSFPAHVRIGCAVLALLAGPARAMAAEPEPPAFSPADRVLVLAPHPDDEVIACAGILQRALAAGAAVRVVFLTYGDNNEWSFAVYRKHPVLEPAAVRNMGLVRREEALAADHVLGLAPEQLVFLGYPDFGTLRVWQEHWGDQPPYQGMLTRATQVPYTNAFRPGAPFRGDDILQDLKTILAEFRPTQVFLSHPADHNPDHRALYLFTRVALWDLAPDPAPVLHPYLVHYKKWPLPRAYAPDAALIPLFNLAPGGGWQLFPLTAGEAARKESALRQHQSQFNYAATYLESFVRRNELFGDFPPIRLAASGPESGADLNRQEPAGELSEELTDAERAAFVGIETRRVWLDRDALGMELVFSRPLAQAVGAQIEWFGYRAGRPFAAMPKWTLRIGEFSHRVYDRGRPLPDADIEVAATPRTIRIRVPLQALGDPDRILTSARTTLGDVPLDWVSWRVIELPPAAGPAPAPAASAP